MWHDAGVTVITGIITVFAALSFLSLVVYGMGKISEAQARAKLKQQTEKESVRAQG